MPDAAPRVTTVREKVVQLLIAASLVAAVCVATQYVAWRLGFHPHLGRAALVVPANLLTRWRIAAPALAGCAAALLPLRGWRRLAPIMVLAALALAWVAWVSGGRVRSEARQEGQGRTLSERGRRLMTPDEVRRLAPDRELVFIKGTRPLNLRRLNYLTDREFAGRHDPNPLHARRGVS